MLSCLSPRSPGCGPKAAVSLMSERPARASSECTSSRVTDAGCASSATRLPASGRRSLRSLTSRSIPNCIELQRKGARVVEVGLAARVLERPVRQAATRFFNDHRQAKRQRRPHIGGRRDSREIHERVEIEPRYARLDSDLRVQGFVGECRALAVSGERISGPFPRRREIEFMVSLRALLPHEELAAGVAPELPADARRTGGRNAQRRDLAVNRVVQRQFSLAGSGRAGGHGVYLTARR